MQGNEKPSAASLEDIYLEYVAPIRAYLYRMSGDRDLAQDLVQEVFYRATRSLLMGKRIDYVSSWLYRIARNLYLDHVSRIKPKYEVVYYDELDHYGSYGVEEISRGLERRDMQMKIQQTLKLLPETQKTVLLLRDYQELSYAEIAGVMDITVSAVKSLLFRARLNFRTHYLKLTAEEGENNG